MSSALLPTLPTLEAIGLALGYVAACFQGVERLRHATAARTIFVLAYAGAVEGADRWIRPTLVTRMTDAQALRVDDAERLAWLEQALRPVLAEVPGRWYAENTRESIRRDILRDTLLAIGAVVERPGLSPTSAAPRWALARAFLEAITRGDPQEIRRWASGTRRAPRAGPAHGAGCPICGARVPEPSRFRQTVQVGSATVSPLATTCPRGHVLLCLPDGLPSTQRSLPLAVAAVAGG